ncbi:MAG: hypothetical protein C0623_02675 [Desulfuromonas sp.]|nr:MAG: hypothetical protein C0623_02675 [Desulfuromonas sp.]
MGTGKDKSVVIPDSDRESIVAFDSPPLLLRSLPPARALNRSPTATATETFRVCLEANSPAAKLNRNNSDRKKSPLQGSRFLHTLLWLNKMSMAECAAATARFFLSSVFRGDISLDFG